MIQQLATPLPEGFCREMHALPGIDSDALLASLQTPPSVSIRLNPGKPALDPPFAECEAVGWCADGRYLSDRPVFAAMPEWHAGAFYVQDASSMIHCHIGRHIAEIAGKSRLRVLDLCAAPGGKTTALAAALPSGSLIVANECVPRRARILTENTIKWGGGNILAASASSTAWSKAAEAFDIVAVDAPCSGEGMMRKEDVARSQWSPALVAQCASLQQEILRDAMCTLRPGGFLIYSTCTFNRRENELNAEWLAQEFGLEPVAIHLPDSCSASKGIATDIPCLRFMPHLTRGEGLFVTVMRKPGEFTQPRTPKSGKPGKGRPHAAQTEAEAWLDPARGLEATTEGNRIYARQKEHASFIATLQRIVPALPPGFALAEMKGKSVIPAHAAIMSGCLRADAFPKVQLSQSEACSYLRREPVALPADTPSGYVIASYNGVELGLLKNLGNRANNLYPNEWRMLLNPKNIDTENE